jgi:hypothetical protein
VYSNTLLVSVASSSFSCQTMPAVWEGRIDGHWLLNRNSYTPPSSDRFSYWTWHGHPCPCASVASASLPMRIRGIGIPAHAHPWHRHPCPCAFVTSASLPMRIRDMGILKPWQLAASAKERSIKCWRRLRSANPATELACSCVTPDRLPSRPLYAYE